MHGRWLWLTGFGRCWGPWSWHLPNRNLAESGARKTRSTQSQASVQQNRVHTYFQLSSSILHCLTGTVCGRIRIAFSLKRHVLFCRGWPLAYVIGFLRLARLIGCKNFTLFSESSVDVKFTTNLPDCYIHCNINPCTFQAEKRQQPRQRRVRPPPGRRRPRRR